MLGLALSQGVSTHQQLENISCVPAEHLFLKEVKSKRLHKVI